MPWLFLEVKLKEGHASTVGTPVTLAGVTSLSNATDSFEDQPGNPSSYKVIAAAGKWDRPFCAGLGAGRDRLWLSWSYRLEAGSVWQSLSGLTSTICLSVPCRVTGCQPDCCHCASVVPAPSPTVPAPTGAAGRCERLPDAVRAETFCALKITISVAFGS